MAQTPKIALIGIGRWGKNILKTLDEMGYEPVVIHKDSPDTTKWLEEHYPSLPTLSLEECLSDPSITTVCIATPIKTHYPIAKKALKSGKHVFIEKPGSETSEEYSELITLAKSKRLALMTGYLFTHHEMIEELAKHSFTNIIFNWKKMGSFEEDIRKNLLVHELSILYTLGITEWNIQEKQLEDNYLTISLMGNQTIPVTISIDRASEEKEKKITFTTENGEYVWLNDSLITGETVTEQKEAPLKRELTFFLDNISRPEVFTPNQEMSKEILKTLSLL